MRLQLKRQRFGRPKSRRPVMSWSVEWESDRPVPVQPGKGGITGGSVKVTDRAVTNGLWIADACIQLCASVAEQRVRYDYSPAEEGSDR
ncbi:hypothetical protein ACFQX6_11135 [Streptosporangium lutulentum]